MKITRFLAAAFLFLLAAPPLYAQQARVVSSCGGLSPAYDANTTGTVTMDTSGRVCGSSGGSGGGSGSQPYNYTAVTGAQYGLTIATSTALTVPATALQAQVCVSGNSVKYTFDGTTPTASVGLPLATGQCMQFSGATLLAALRFIQTAATATLDVGYTK